MEFIVDGDFVTVAGVSVYHERQRSGLCGKHAINCVVQQNLFEERHLFSIARMLHRIENNLLDVEEEIGYENSPYFKESGEFNVTVLDQALRFCNLELRQQASINQDSFLSTLAILINVNNTHWFTISRVGHQWFEFEFHKT
jgi:hypothetical protein